MHDERDVSRREFVARAAGALGAAGLVPVVAGCGDGQFGPTVPPGVPAGRFSVTVSNFPALATVGLLVAVAPLRAAKRTGSAAFDAFDMTCTHLGCATSIVNGQRFDCPCHGSSFDSNGTVIRNPATSPLTKLATSYDPATDKLTIG